MPAKLKCKSGFTLIELLTAVLIIAVLAAVGMPQYQKAKQQIEFSVHLDYLRTIVQAEDRCAVIYGPSSGCPGGLDVEIGDSDTFTVSSQPDPDDPQHYIVTFLNLCPPSEVCIGYADGSGSNTRYKQYLFNYYSSDRTFNCSTITIDDGVGFCPGFSDTSERKPLNFY
ncbi:MAG: prepilin-type N-terminal cleavage/methylation domain-containing protein [Elusimicrobia bacterium]|nr:prepilin-type N-terminal cleavage/methylation domain-containing protein [Elusimicrobiota bacterium]